MFGCPSDISRHEATRAYMNTKIKMGISMREHVLKMISLLHEAEMHGDVMFEKTQVAS